jgi:hypothetical protein
MLETWLNTFYIVALCYGVVIPYLISFQRVLTIVCNTRDCKVFLVHHPVF